MPSASERRIALFPRDLCEHLAQSMPNGWGETGDGAAFLEALHRADLETGSWLDEAWRTFSSLVPGATSLLAGVARWTPGKAGLVLEVTRSPIQAHAQRSQETSHLATKSFVNAFTAPKRVAILSELLGPQLPEPMLIEILTELGIVDFLTLKSDVPAGNERRGAAVSVLSSKPIKVSRRARANFDAYAAHLMSAFRLRESGLGAATEGVLSPTGRCLHAEGALRDGEAQDALKRAVLAIERARRKDRRTDQVALLEAWRAIYERRWTLVETIESDGRRMLLARVNPPAQHVDAKMTPREREVAALVAQGVPQKAVGYELALSPSTVAFHVRNIAKKLGASSTTDLVRVLALAAQREA